MRVEVAYERRIEAFDTDRFTRRSRSREGACSPTSRSSTRLPRRTGLWLTAHCYAANEGYRTDGEDVPEARREKGWRFQLASPKEAGELESVTMDGETVLARMFGELVDVMKLDRASALFAGPGGSVASRIARLNDYLSNADERLAASSVLMAEAIGVAPGRARVRHSSRGRPDGARGRRRERLDGRIRR